MRFTSNDVARLAGVSQSTVSRAFKNDKSMSPETRDKVLAAAQKLSYVPNSFARSLTTQKSNIVAIVVANLKNSFYTESLAMFSRKLRERGKHLLLFSIGSAAETDSAVREILEYQVDGIILTSADASMKTAEICLNRRIPVVTFNRYVPGTQVNSICCDNIEAGKVMTRHLVAAGAKTFLVVYGEKEATTNQDRLTGFHAALEEAGIPAGNATFVCGNYSYEGAFDAVVESLTSGNRVDAVLCLNDVMAMGAIDALKYRIGLHVPNDVMVAGFDDIPEAARPAYDLTTVRQPIERMTDEALDLLGLGEKGTASTALVRMVPGVLIERGTVLRSH
ncbi:MAG: LacI family DNA-binding transcriptional regulator [Sphingobium sp.]